MIVRFDDIYADDAVLNHAWDIQCVILCLYPDAEIIYGVSLAWFSAAGAQRVYPKSFNPLSDFRCHYRPDRVAVPVLPKNVVKASHGLIHVDHRLLSPEVQELSVLLSCSLLECNMFIPPFNKWDQDLEEICCENNIELVKYEDGWWSMEHNDFDANHDRWYMHPRAFTKEGIHEYLSRRRT